MLPVKALSATLGSFKMLNSLSAAGLRVYTERAIQIYKEGII